jgi:hypothetical protein
MKLALQKGHATALQFQQQLVSYTLALLLCKMQRFTVTFDSYTLALLMCKKLALFEAV